MARRSCGLASRRCAITNARFDSNSWICSSRCVTRQRISHTSAGRASRAADSAIATSVVQHPREHVHPRRLVEPRQQAPCATSPETATPRTARTSRPRRGSVLGARRDRDVGARRRAQLRLHRLLFDDVHLRRARSRGGLSSLRLAPRRVTPSEPGRRATVRGRRGRRRGEGDRTAAPGPGGAGGGVCGDGRALTRARAAARDGCGLPARRSRQLDPA